MRSGVLTNLVMVALCACATAAEQPVQSFPGDIIMVAVDEPNTPSGQVPPPGQDAPEPWDPGKHLLATWESISTVRTHRIYNPTLQPPREPEGPGWSLSLAGQIDILDSSRLVGFATIPTAALALDQDARVVFSELSDSLQNRVYQAPRYRLKPTEFGEWISEIQPYPFSVNLPVGPGTTYPQVLGTLEWSMHALVTDQFTNVDIPFQAGATWIELVPGLEIRVEQAVAENVQYQYLLQARYDSSEVSNMLGETLHLPAGQAPLRVIIVNLDVLDALGRSIRSLGDVAGGIGVGTGGTGSQTMTLIRGIGYGPACGTAATLRFKLARNAYTRQIRCILDNVPVPSFTD